MIATLLAALPKLRLALALAEALARREGASPDDHAAFRAFADALGRRLGPAGEERP